MATKKYWIIMVAGLLVLAAAVLIVGLQVREQQLAQEQAGTIKLIAAGQEYVIPFSRLDRDSFSGETVNGKGEAAVNEYRGIELSALLRENDINPDQVKGAVATAADQYSAEYTGDEIREAGKIFLVVQSNGKQIEGIDPGSAGVWMIPFRDPNGRRIIRNPARIEIK
ncbi:MAG: hypothetical protein J6U01_01425 [Clostridia bacterium]|nr:hypothetical protein [Clostridia bacterium]